MIIGSGNVVHNLGRIDWSSPTGGYDSTRRFDERALEIMTIDPASIMQLADHRDWAEAVPTPDHFLPLAYIAGIASAAGTTAKTLVEGYAFGSLSMTSFVVDR
jgi:4,5-DOPA dioxygenase extradiol